MNPLLRIATLSALAAMALLPTASAQAASYFKSESNGVSLEVHVDDRQIIYLFLRVPITCDEGGTSDRTSAVIAYGRLPIRFPIDPVSGTFSYPDVPRLGGPVFWGTILNGKIRAHYQFAARNGPGHFCWTGDSLRGSPEQPEGSPVPLVVSRQEGVRFFRDSRFAPDLGPWGVHLWIGGGRVYGLTAVVPETCVGQQAGYPPSTGRAFEYLAPKRVIRVDPRTREIRYRYVDRFPDGREVWKLTAVVSPGHVEGRLSYVRDIASAGSTDHCQTGGKGGPTVRFDALRS